MASAMAIPRRPNNVRPAVPSLFILLLSIIAVSMLDSSNLVRAHSHSGPSTLVFYVHQRLKPPNATTVIAVSPSAASGGPPIGFGSIAVVNNLLLEGASADSAVLGTIYGTGVFELDPPLSIYLSNTYVLSTPKYAGSISVQGATDALGNGEVGITTGTGDFRFARGYAKISGVSQDLAGTGISIFKVVAHIKYD